MEAALSELAQQLVVEHTLMVLTLNNVLMHMVFDAERDCPDCWCCNYCFCDSGDEHLDMCPVTMIQHVLSKVAPEVKGE